MLSNRLVIGLDYGTTFTGVAFCETSDTGVVGKDIIVVQDWPSRYTKIGTKEKVPSEIALNDRSQWGALIAPNVQRHMWTKLLLDNGKVGEVDKILQELSLNDSAVSSSRPVDIIADYLAHVKAHLLKNLEIHYGKELWKTLPVTLIITVPAVWSDAAKDATLQAIDKAGFNNWEMPQLKRTILTTEPEAAAIYTIQSLRGGVQDEQFAVGDGFIVCDMGGGTVDLISYRVAGIEPTALEETTVGTGSQCGGSFVERGFLKWLERRLGKEDFFLIAGTTSDDLPRTSLSPKLSRMVQDFVLEAKNGFSGIEVNFVRLPMPLSAVEDDEKRGIQDGEIKITAADMKEMFSFSLDRTRELVLEQIQQAQRNGKVQLKYIFLVGGFAESPYVYESIKAFAEGYSLQVIRPAHAWSAIVRGAAAKGLEGDGRAPIMTRKCRRFYGTPFSAPFVLGRHKESDSYIDPYDGTKRADNQVKWLLKTGQDLSTRETSHAQFHLVKHFWPGVSRNAIIDLMASDVQNAPQGSQDKDVYKVATLNVDLNGLPQSAFAVRSGVHGLFYELSFSVEIAVQSSLEYSFLVNGTRYGSVTATYA
ncbi:hypothetical protein NX059_007727 [Plenodomus lindquistii]|nr:hypothetical protein NX059_007727 [Plenodomus lindquistii]